jgi:hypothetical protein
MPPPMRPVLAAAAASFLLSAPAFAASTINPAVPAPNAALASAPIRQNFVAAFNDLNGVMGMFGGAFQPANPLPGQDWLDTATAPWTWSKYDGAQWVEIGTLDPTLHAFSLAPLALPQGKWEPACTDVATHDDPIVTDAFTWAAANQGVALLPHGPCAFTTPVAVDTAGGENFWGVIGFNTQLVYQGAPTTPDLIAIGGAAASSNLLLANLSIASNTLMTAGCALHLTDTTHTVLEQVQVNSQNLWKGGCFSGAGGDLWDGIYAATQNDAVSVAGNGGPFAADLWIENGVISLSGTAIHQGGGFGGLFVQGIDMIRNGIGVLYDTALNSTPNQQLFLYPSTQIDSSTGDGVHVQNCAGCTIMVDGHAVLANAKSGVEFDDTSLLTPMLAGLVTGNATAGSSYYGLSCNAAMTVYVNTTIVGNTGARNIAPNCAAVLP